MKNIGTTGAKAAFDALTPAERKEYDDKAAESLRNYYAAKKSLIDRLL